MPTTASQAEKDLLPEGELLRLNEWAVPGAWVLAVVVILAGMFLLVVPAYEQHSFDGALRPVVGLTWLAIGLYIAGGARSGLIVGERGITVQGWVRGTRWEWSEVAGFELKRPFWRPALRIRLIDGAEASTLGFGAKSADERSLAEARVAELNRRAAAVQAS